MKSVFLNGRFVAESEATVSIFDRSFLYGDGLFETLRVYNGKPLFWEQHMERLHRGADFLKIRIPEADLQRFALQLIETNKLPESVLRINLSRGIGARGYSTKGATESLIAMTLHAVPQIDPDKQWKLVTASIRVMADDPLAPFKTCNKLPQIAARIEAEERRADDALLLNSNGDIAETTSCNVFWIKNGTVFTPLLSSGIIAGVTRQTVLELCRKLKIPAVEKSGNVEMLRQSDGAFLTSSVIEIAGVGLLDEKPLSNSPLIAELAEAYRRLIRDSCR